MDNHTNGSQPAAITPSQAAPITAGLTVGFAFTALLWTVGYLLHFPGISVAPVIVGIVLMLLMALGAVRCGTLGPAGSPMKTGAVFGLTLGLLNLLILGSVLFESPEGGDSSRPSPAIVVAGWLAFAIIVGLLGAKMGSMLRPAPAGMDQSRPAWLARFGVVAALTMLPLLLVGGVVTTSDSGMAVPDWPNTFGTNMFLFPLSRMTGGVYFEHTHRLFGAMVGLTALTLMVLTLGSQRCGKTKALAVGVFLFITLQGVLGGVRVTEASKFLALLHGVAAQIAFAMLVTLAAMCSMRWNDGHEPTAAPGVRKIKRLAWATMVITLLQIAFGGMIRHFGDEELPMHAVMTHAGWSLVVIAHVFMVSSKIAAIKDAPKHLRRIAHAMLAIVSLQMLLGFIALGVAMVYQDRAEAPTIRLVMGATHQTLGAILFGAVTLSLVWTKRSLVDDGTSPKKTAPAETGAA